jgi:hypothetical protein
VLSQRSSPRAAPSPAACRLAMIAVAAIVMDLRLSGALLRPAPADLVPNYFLYFPHGFPVADVFVARPKRGRHPARWDRVFLASMLLLLAWPAGRFQAATITPGALRPRDGRPSRLGRAAHPVLPWIARSAACASRST